jgi:hypothetical protein
MIEALTSQAEIQASAAERLPAFSGLSLLHIKRQLAELLALFGRGGVFDEYTKHDISHIDAALDIATWLIPADTASIMSPSDWLLIVLAVYFHDLGLVVTKSEYDNRDRAALATFRDQILYAGASGADYREKVERLGSPDAIDRFLYQEFVRSHHAERIKNWITGRETPGMGPVHALMEAIQELLSKLDPEFRRDLAMVCESHHLDDLDDFEKYSISKPYGNSANETANVHYAAIILRTADLLHVTRDRTPSILFKVVAPADPVSQAEWHKPMAVRSVCSFPDSSTPTMRRRPRLSSRSNRRGHLAPKRWRSTSPSNSAQRPS